jgi:IS30 family transposase
LTITGIIENECKSARISEKELKNGSKRMIVRTVREKVARRGVEELGLTSAEIARNLGVCTSTITRALSRSEVAA